MPFISKDGLKTLLFSHVVELKFQRRHKKGDELTRRMFCTGSYPNFHNQKFLATVSAQSALNFRYPKGPIPYHPKPYFNPDQKNLVISFDIFMQDYRCITVNRCNVIRAFPVDSDENIKKFWQYFNKYIIPMSAQQKTDFMKK
jgi:hypothetical protein